MFGFLLSFTKVASLWLILVTSHAEMALRHCVIFAVVLVKEYNFAEFNSLFGRFFSVEH